MKHHERNVTLGTVMVALATLGYGAWLALCWLGCYGVCLLAR